MPNPGVNRKILFGQSGNIPIQYGYLFSDNYSSNTISNYTTFGTATASISGGVLQVGGGSGSATFSDYINYSGYGLTSTDTWTQTFTFQIKSLTAATDAIGIGIRGSQNYAPFSLYGAMLITTVAGNRGRLKLYLVSGGTLYVQADSVASLLTINLNDTIQFTLTYNKSSYSFTATNLTSPNTLTLNFVPATTSTATANLSHTIGYFSILAFSGSQYVSNWSVTTNDYKYSDFAYVGHSISQGWCSSDFTNKSYRGLAALALANKKFNSFSKINALTSDIINILPEIYRFKPKKVGIMIGCNDVYTAIPSATIYANMDTINSGLYSAGITPVWFLATPFNGIDVSGINNKISTSFRYVDTNTPLMNGNQNTPNASLYAADLVHPNDSGHGTLNTTIISASII